MAYIYPFHPFFTLWERAIAVGNTPRYTYGAIIPYRTGYTERFAIPRLPLTMNRHGNNLFIVYFSMTSRGTGDSRLNMVITAQRAHGVRSKKGGNN